MMNADGKDIKKAVEERKAAEAEALAPKETDDPITPELVSECLLANARGDGILFITRHQGSFIFNVTSNEWFRWADHHWEKDRLMSRYEAVEAIALKYLEGGDRKSKEIDEAVAAKKTDKAKGLRTQREQYYRRAKRLRDDGADKCLTWACRVEGGLGVRGEEFDCKDWLLACRNGVLELATGRFRSGRPGDLLTMAVPHEWTDIDTPAPAWEQFLGDVFAGDELLIAYVQRLFGYGITGLTQEHILPVLHGAGRNGKGTLVETLRYVLGDLVRPIQAEMLLDQRSSRASSGPSPDIMSLKGVRMAFASETDEGRRFSTSKAKWLSGGDTLTGRNPHDKYETVFPPTHLLCLLTNHLPHAHGDDYAFWSRVHLVPFKVQFVDEPQGESERARDKTLPEKLKAEAPGILAWLVRGCLEWQRQGLNPPPVVRSATEEYRFSEDTIGEFLDACCQPLEQATDEDRVQFGEIYTVFEEWYEKTIGDKKYCPRKKKFSQLMEKKFRRDKVGGLVWFYGVSLKSEIERW